MSDKRQNILIYIDEDIADYGTSSSSESDSEKSDEEIVTEENKCESLSMKLPKPDFDGSSSKNSVFSNPFVEAENAKKAILEKHVKMVPTKDKVEMINGKKICWNYRKGRCHFGHNCTFAHDSDLQRSQEELESENQIQSTLLCEKANNQGPRITQAGGMNQAIEDTPPDESEDKWENQLPTKLKRPGLTPGLIPSKKAKKFFKKTNNSNFH